MCGCFSLWQLVFYLFYNVIWLFQRSNSHSSLHFVVLVRMFSCQLVVIFICFFACYHNYELSFLRINTTWGQQKELTRNSFMKKKNAQTFSNNMNRVKFQPKTTRSIEKSLPKSWSTWKASMNMNFQPTKLVISPNEKPWSFFFSRTLEITLDLAILYCKRIELTFGRLKFVAAA